MVRAHTMRVAFTLLACTALSPALAQAPGPMAFPPASGADLVASYPLDGDGRDVVGRADGTLRGAVPVEDRLGNPQGALAFGGRDAIEIGVRAEPEAFTVAAWILPARVDREMAIFSKWSSNPGPRDRYLELRVEPGGRLALAIPGGRGAPQVLRSSRVLAPGRWAHVAATFDGARAVLYVDGALDRDAGLAPFEGSRGPVLVGARPDPSGRWARARAFFVGRMDDLRLYRGALGGRELAALVGPPPRPAPGTGDRGGPGNLPVLVRVDRLVARFDAACAQRDAAALARTEARALEELDRAEREVRAQPGGGALAQRVRRAAGELRGLAGRTDALSLDRKRTALFELSDAAWNDLARDLDDATFDGRGRDGVDDDRW